MSRWDRALDLGRWMRLGGALHYMGEHLHNMEHPRARMRGEHAQRLLEFYPLVWG